MEQILMGLFTTLATQIPFALLIYVVMERQQDRHEKNAKQMLEAVNRQNELYQKIIDATDQILSKLYIMDKVTVSRKVVKK
jgi:hypothetical protein